MSSKIFIQPVVNNFDEYLKYAIENGYNLEIASFAFPDVLDTKWKSLVEEYKKKLENFTGIISTHGAFLDLNLHSNDNEIRKLAEKRIYHNLEIAKDLNAQYTVFHTNYNPLINHESYRRNWLKIHTKFWKEVIQEYQITIVLENLWEPNPNWLKKLLKQVNSQFLKVCFDTGHVNIFSKIPMSEWISILNDEIVYDHINDNEGEIDNELIPGKGTINWRTFSNAIKENSLKPNIIFEVGTLEKTISSIKFFEENQIYPF